MDKAPFTAIGVRTRAAARYAVLQTRVHVMEAVAAITDYDRTSLQHTVAAAERTRQDIATSERIAELTGKIATSTQALSHLESGTAASRESVAMADRAREEINELNNRLSAAIDDRVAKLSRLNDQVARLEADRTAAAARIVAALDALGTRSGDLHALVDMVGHPEASELLECVSRPRRAARASYLLELMKAEAENAGAQLARVGSSLAYDHALHELMEAESSHTLARRHRDWSARQCDRALGVLLRAAQALADAAARLPGGPLPPVCVSGSLDAQSRHQSQNAGANGSAPAGSEPGAHPETPPLQGQGSPGTDYGPVSVSRSDDVHPDPVVPAPEVAQS